MPGNASDDELKDFGGFFPNFRMGVIVCIFTVVAPILALFWTTLSWRDMSIFWVAYLLTQNIPPYFSRTFFKWRWGGRIFLDENVCLQVKHTKAEVMDPVNQSYVFVWHPHGRLFMGIGSFVSNMYEWLPEIEAAGKHVYIGIQDAMFRIPFLNSWLSLLGLIPVNKHSIKKALGDGNSVCVVVGGIDEVLLGTFDDKDVLFLRNRKGFVKVAMDMGSGIVPVYCFGENLLFTHSTWSLEIWRLINCAVSIGAPFPIFGRWGLPLPFNRPIQVSIGKPLFAEAGETLHQFHARYIEALKNLYEENVSSTHDPKRALIIA